MTLKDKLLAYDERMRLGQTRGGMERVAPPSRSPLPRRGVRMIVAALASFVVAYLSWQQASGGVFGLWKVTGTVLATLFAAVGVALLYLAWRWRASVLRRSRSSELAALLYGICMRVPALVEVEQGGDGKRRVERLAVPVWVSEDADEIRVYVVRRPGRALSELNKLGEQFAVGLGIELSAQSESVSEVTYVYRKNREARLVVRPEDFAEINENPTSVIPLTTETSWDMAKVPHCMISGTTGGGKSVLLNYLILSLLKDKAEVFCIDPKRSDLYGVLMPILGPQRVACEGASIAKVVRLFSEEVTRRFEYMESDFKPFSDYRSHPEISHACVLICDEMSAMWASLDKKTREEVERHLVSAIMRGRQAGCFCILATQQSRAEVIRTDVRSQLGAAFFMGKKCDSISAQMTFGNQANGCEFMPREGKGVGWYFLQDGVQQQVRPFDAPYFDASVIDVPATARRLYEANPRNRAKAEAVNAEES